MKLLVQLVIAAFIVVASNSHSIQSEQEVLLAPTAPEPARSKDPGESAQAIADAVIEGLASEKFTLGYEYMPAWAKASDQKRTEAKVWRMKEGWDRWRDLKARLEGDNGLDPKDKSGITGSEEKWLGATDSQRWAVITGIYRVYSAEEWEKRLKDGGWFMVNRQVKLEVEGQGQSKFGYSNRYNDSISVSCYREGGNWYLAHVELKIERAMPEKPKD